MTLKIEKDSDGRKTVIRLSRLVAWRTLAESRRIQRRRILGNPLSMKAYREGALPFPDGAVLAKLAWKHVPSAEFDGAFVPGPATTVQFMVKDSKSTPPWAVGDSGNSWMPSQWTRRSTRHASLPRG
jgi:hypothetical protein